jgi:uncharacterized protein (DUF1800 family)
MQPVSQTVESGCAAVFSAPATSSTGGIVTYQWYWNGIGIIGAIDPTYVVYDSSASNNGTYLCVATDSNGSATSGNATLDVVSSSDPGRLINISSRALSGNGANQLIAGYVVGGSGTSGSEAVLIRASGPALAGFGVSGALPDPELTLNAPTGVLAINSGWGGNPEIASVASSVGAFAWNLSSIDSALVETLSGGPYTAQVTGASGDTGVALAEVYDATPSGSYTFSSPRLINISTRGQVGTGADIIISGFVIGGSTSKSVLIRASGPALSTFGIPGYLPDPELSLYRSNGDGTNTLLQTNTGWGGNPQISAAAGSAGAFSWGSYATPDSAILVTLSPGAYTAEVFGAVGDTGVALVEIYDVDDNGPVAPIVPSGQTTIYFASLHPTTSAVSSTASGYATILLDSNTNTATISISFSNLSTTETGAHLTVGDSGSGGNIVLDFPIGQVGPEVWAFPAAGPYSSLDLINALTNGQLSVEIDSSTFPGGELQGGFSQTSGTQVFVPPSAPPALAATALTAPTQTDAARLLTQATFGVTSADVNAVMSSGINAWIANQMALPATSLDAGLIADAAAFPDPQNPAPNTPYAYTTIFNLDAAWWKIVSTAPDQLRQRVAFALSEIFVIGNMCEINGVSEGEADYYDTLVNDAFGNFRQLLDDVTLNPVMGTWLSMIENPKANPVTGTNPDENYAREVQQLFTIGLVQLQPDGTIMLDSTGEPIPTYNQTTITETAKVFTGWAFAISDPSATDMGSFTANAPSSSFNPPGTPSPWLVPMRYFDAFHDKTQKSVVSLQQVPLSEAQPTVIPANQSGPQDLKLMLDTLFNHPNTGPFICRQLIQKLVTSNPSPGYVYRVAQVFANDGTGVRGNLAAVITAILTDYEARSPNVIGNVGYGKAKEPIIELVSFFRALNVSAPNGRFLDSYYGDPRQGGGYFPAGVLAWTMNFLPEQVMYSTTVFNFFSPAYSPPGPLAAAGLVAPELQMIDTNYAILIPDVIMDFMYRDVTSLVPPATGASPFLVPDYSALLPLAGNPGALVDQMNLLFCANGMTQSTRAQILSTLEALPSGTTPTEIVQTAVQLTFMSPDGTIQK